MVNFASDPSPIVTISGPEGTLIITPMSFTTAVLQRFQIASWRGGSQLGLLRARALLREVQFDGYAISDLKRLFAAMHETAPPEPFDMVQLLTYELTLGGKFHAFYIPPESFGRFAVAKAPDLNGLLADPPGAPAVWSVAVRIAAMLRRVPAHVAPELKAQVAALLAPKLIALLAIFLSSLAIAQAYGVGEIVDAILVGLAWWVARWAGLLAVKDIVTSIIEAGRAQSLPAIDEAAGLFARALLVLGTAFLTKLIYRAGDEQNVSELAAPSSAPPDLSPPVLRSTPRTIAPPSETLQKYLARSGGRLGGTTTRSLNNNIATNLENSGFTVTNGAGRGVPEEFIPGLGGGVNGSNYVDITATDGTSTIRVQTIDTLADGITPTPREALAAARIQ